MDIDSYAKKVRQSQQGAALDALARSADADRLLAGVDREKLEQAARSGDMKALGRMLQGILSTEEGRRLASQVQKAVDGSGR